MQVGSPPPSVSSDAGRLHKMGHLQRLILFPRLVHFLPQTCDCVENFCLSARPSSRSPAWFSLRALTATLQRFSSPFFQDSATHFVELRKSLFDGR